MNTQIDNTVTAFDQGESQLLLPIQNDNNQTIRLPYINKGLDNASPPGESPRKLGRFKN